MIGTSTAQFVQEMIESDSQPRAGWIAFVVGVVGIIFGSTSFFFQLKDALNTVWEVAPKPGYRPLDMIRNNALSFAMVLGQAPQARASELAACIGLSLLLWLVPYIELGIPIRLAFLYPITLLANEVVAFQSLRLSIARRLTWKGRPLTQAHWRWF